MQNQETLKEIFNAHQGYATLKELRRHGVDFYQLKKLRESGLVRLVKRGLYHWNDQSSPETELPELARIVPQGVFCLFSACHWHELGDYVPFEYHIAVERSRRIQLPEYPPIKLYYWNGDHLALGVFEVETPQGNFRITDLEKTVCDMVKYRNKTGKDSLRQVLNDYVRRKDRNLNRLISYARAMRLEKIIRTYLETLVEL